MDKRHMKDQGMNWIRQEKRLAIYLRDGLACCYCGTGVEEQITLTLDHLKAYAHGGGNDATNLVTCCHRCNSARGKRSWRKFAGHVAAYINHGVTAAAITDHISRTRMRTLDVAAAKDLMARRGGLARVLQSSTSKPPRRSAKKAAR